MPHEGVNKNTTIVNGREIINFGSYNYLGMSGNERVAAYAKEAIDRYGTSVSASRIVSGEIPLHRMLEQKLAAFIGAEDCIVYVGGYGTNVSTIGHLFNGEDLILHDAYVHNSALEGCRLAGATCMAFRHNDCAQLESLLEAERDSFRRVLIIIEGAYSTEGDIADLPAIISLKEKYDALLMVDEAHSIGVLGTTGRGIGEHFHVNPHDVDLWMGTLSKSLASCGGYIASTHELIDYLKYTAPGFIFSVGISPANVAASIAVLDILNENPGVVSILQQRSERFFSLANARGLDTGTALGTAIIPVMTGDSARALRSSQELLAHDVHVSPLVYPAVRNRAARLRFFVAADHSEEQIDYTVDKVVELMDTMNGNNLGARQV